MGNERPANLDVRLSSDVRFRRYLVYVLRPFSSYFETMLIFGRLAFLPHVDQGAWIQKQHDHTPSDLSTLHPRLHLVTWPRPERRQNANAITTCRHLHGRRHYRRSPPDHCAYKEPVSSLRIYIPRSLGLIRCLLHNLYLALIHNHSPTSQASCRNWNCKHDLKLRSAVRWVLLAGHLLPGFPRVLGL